MNSEELSSPVMNKAYANVNQDSKELNAWNAMLKLTMVPSAKSVDAINLDQLASPVIKKANAHVKEVNQDSMELNALNVKVQLNL